MEFTFDFLSPAVTDRSYFDSYFESSPPLSTTTASRHSPMSSLGSSFGTLGTATSCAGVTNVDPGGAVPRSSDTEVPIAMTQGYVKPPDRIHHWLAALQPTISSALDKGHHHCFLAGGEHVKIAPVSDLFPCIRYHHLFKWLGPIAPPSLQPTTSCINHLPCLFRCFSTHYTHTSSYSRLYFTLPLPSYHPGNSRTLRLSLVLQLAAY